MTFHEGFGRNHGRDTVPAATVATHVPGTANLGAST
jgi:hypothetical protein